MTMEGGGMPGLPDAHLLETGHQCFKVRPGVAAVRRDEGFDFRNTTIWWASVHFPNEALVADEPLKSSSELLLKLFPGVAVKLLVNSIGWAPPLETVHFALNLSPGVYDYTVIVYTDHGPVQADGDSAPKIIVDP